MGSRRLVVGALATAAVGVAAGGVAAGRAPTGGVTVGIGGAGAGARALGAILWLLVAVVVVVGGVGLVLERVRRVDATTGSVRPRLIVLGLAIVFGVLGVVLVAVRVFEDGSGPRRQDGVGGPLLQGSPDAVATPAGPGAGVVLGVLAAVVLTGTILATYRLLRARATSAVDASATADDDPPTAADDDGRDDVGQAAARAADHLSGSGKPAENDVMRAYRELEAVVPVSRSATTTPREFAAAATDAGVDPDAVRELTALFETVRYGDREPTAELGGRAVAALERIEADAPNRRSRKRGSPGDSPADPPGGCGADGEGEP